MEYAALWDEVGRTGGKIVFADEAHFRADAELQGKWVLKGEPAARFHEGRLCRGTARTSTAASDRVVHHSTILEFDFPSYRTDAAQQRGQAEEVNRQN